MRKRLSPEERIDRTHYEGLVRTIIVQIGPERLADIIDYVVDEMRAEELRLRNFALECRRAIEH
jgi:hypothetical protein